MITISNVEDTHLWCQSCYTKEVELFAISIDMQHELGNINNAYFRLCQNCLQELHTKASSVL